MKTSQLSYKKFLKKKKCTSLSLATNNITADGVQMLVNAFKTNKKLTHLILSGNPMGDQGIKFIRELITNSRTLYHLSLADTDLTDDGLKLITPILSSNSTSLRCLDLRSNRMITDLSIDSLLQMVEHNQTLSACRLDNCGLSQYGKEKLQETKSIKW